MASKRSATKPFAEWDFNELADYVSGQIAISLADGSFKARVYHMCSLVLQWDSDRKKTK